MRFKNESLTIKLDLESDEVFENDDNAVDPLMDLYPAKPVSKPSYEELLYIIEHQRQLLDLQKNTIVNLEQQLIILKPQV